MLNAAHTAVTDATPPLLIQGGMGVAVSNHRLARAVAMTGHLGVVSGVAIDLVLARRLQDGDPGREMRNAMARFPVPARCPNASSATRARSSESGSRCP